MAGSGRKVLSVTFSAEGIENVKRGIEDLGKAGQDAAAKITSAFAKSTIGQELGARINALKLRFAQTVTAAQRFGNAWAGVGKNLKGFTDAISGAIARVTKLTGAIGLAAFAANRFMQGFGSNAEQIQNSADALGLTTDQYQRLTAAASDVSIEQDKLDKILAKFTVGVEDAGDAAEKAAKKNDGLGKSFEQVAVKANDGSTKIVTIRRGVQDLSKDTAKFNGITKTGVEGLLQYAKSLEAAGGPAEQLQKATRDFGARDALLAIRFFKSLSFQFDDNARAAAGLIQPLTNLELLVGNNLDTAFDNLGTNLTLIKGRLAAVFAPVYTEIIKSLTFWIKDNEQWLISWANTIRDYATQYVKDFIAILKGAPDQVQNKWLVDLYNGALEFGRGLKYVFTQVIPEAFANLRYYADKAAKALNDIFGTDLTGDSLLVVIALGYLTGAFDIFIKAALLVGSTVYAVAQTFRFLSIAVDLVFAALRPLFFLIGYLGAALGTLLGLPAAVGVAIVAALVVAGVLLYAYWDDVKAYVQMTWDAIVALVGKAIDDIVATFSKVSTEWSALWDRLSKGDWSGLWDEIKRQSESFWSDLIASTKTDVENINKALQAIGVDLPAVWDHIRTGASGIWDDIVAGADALGGRLSPAWERVKAGASSLWKGVTDTAQKVWDSVAGIITNAASGIAKAVSAVWTAASEAISGATSSVFDTASGILDAINQAVSAAGNVQGAIDLAAKLVAPFTDARQSIEDIWTGLKPVLEAKGGEIAAALGNAFAPVKNLPADFSQATNGIPATLDGVVSIVAAKFAELAGVASDTAQGIARDINAALSGITVNVNLNGIVSAFQSAAQAIVSAWGAGMNAVRDQTSSMVSAVEGLISQLVSYLSQLRAAIARAQSQAASSGGVKKAGGGYVSGPGTGISDSIRAWLSNGEFVIKARAVKHWGLDTLYALNSMRVPQFAAGGFVGDMAAAVAPRGLFPRPLDGAKSGLTPYTLVFEGKQFPGFMGPPPDTLKQLGKARAISRVSTPNRVPKWKA